MAEREGYVAQRPLTLEGGRVIDPGEEITDFEDSAAWPNMHTLLRLKWVTKQVIDPKANKPGVTVFESEDERTASDFTVAQMKDAAPGLDRETAQTYLDQENAQEKPRPGVVEALTERLATYHADDLTVDELEELLPSLEEDAVVALLEEERTADDPRSTFEDACLKRLEDFKEPEDGGASDEEIRTVLEKSAAEVIAIIKETQNVGELERARVFEEEGKGRTTVLAAIDKQLEALS